MPVGTLLFSTQGRIGPRLFWRGVILLVGIQVVMQLLSLLVPEGLQSVLAVASFFYTVALFIGYLGVYAKRLHDAGHTAWFFLIAMVAGFVLEGVMMVAGVRLLMPELWDAYQKLVEDISSPQAELYLQDVELIILDNTFTYFSLYLASMFLANAIVAFIVARLPSDRGTNRFGPPNDVTPTFD